MRWSDELKARWKSFIWPAMQWCREIMIRLYEVDFQEVPDCVQRKVALYENAQKTTLPCENGGNKLRHREKAQITKRICKVDKLHTLNSSSVQRDFDRRPCPVTAAAEQCRPKKVGDDFFSAAGWRHSLGEKYDALGQPATWPAMTREARMLGFLSWASMVQCQGDWVRHFGLWQGRLAVDTHLVGHTVTGTGRIRIHSLVTQSFKSVSSFSPSSS